MVFSTLDLTSGYWQVEMAGECKPYTAFTCGPLGFFECGTMPFGATKAGLKLKPSKCTFFKTEITYLGHLITSEGVGTDPKKIKAVIKWPRPKTVHDVRSF